MKQLLVVGNVGMDAEIKNANGSSFLSFTVAVNERYTKADGTKVETTDWINVNYRNTKLCPYLKKGTKVLVQGDLKVQVYKSQKDGTHRASINVAATTIEFLGGSKKEETAPDQQASTTPQSDDVPFGSTGSAAAGPATFTDVADDLPF